ncbi:[FeFe] hydrogenase H-cluster radical SAM maturase HydE [Patescibacteria group bacterium]|nr:[FeFe] hydrogenase H-cluster radical SAM maturase HydE [Patescibacteria group bacterium]MBU4454935.1 [FeFe] hydrogenase H-cluster radical SAM maturase HydE [Patescibacteria group bacterium]
MLKKIRKFDRKTLLKYLRATGKRQAELFELARQIKEEVFGQRIWFRGIIEFSNICRNDCYYCGIRRSNAKQMRFQMSLKEIDDCLKFIKSADYGSVVFQSGELTTRTFKNQLLEIVKLTHKKYPNLGITVSCGEQDFAYLKKLKAAGASRYLLRIETSSRKLYKKLHPREMSWRKRFECLKNLQKLSYQVGTGVMVGLPGQTIEDLISDLKFFVDNKFDMFGIGPYVIHKDTPLGRDPKIQKWWQKNKEKNFSIFLNFLAILRVLLPNVNIAAATACDVFDPLGRIKVLRIAGNVIMPSVTPKDYRDKYLLYENKPNIDEGADKSFEHISNKIIQAGLKPIFGEQGNSPFYYQRIYG